MRVPVNSWEIHPTKGRALRTPSTPRLDGHNYSPVTCQRWLAGVTRRNDDVNVPGR